MHAHFMYVSWLAYLVSIPGDAAHSPYSKARFALRHSIMKADFSHRMQFISSKAHITTQYVIIEFPAH